MTANVLSVRDTNMQLKPTPSPEKDGKPKSLEYHRQVLQSRMGSEPTQQYVSPSDEIMSPATQKLQTFKTKHAMKNSRPQTLFKKTSSKNFESSKSSAMFADIPKKASPAERTEEA